MTLPRVIILRSSGNPDAIRAMAANGWRCIARPGSVAEPGEILAWCDDESDEGLTDIERANACIRLGCIAVELVDAAIYFADADAGTVTCKAWVEKLGTENIP